MNTFRMHVRLDNAAFDDSDELPRLLRRVAGVVTAKGAEPCHAQQLLDINGNVVGQWKIIEEGES